MERGPGERCRRSSKDVPSASAAMVLLVGKQQEKESHSKRQALTQCCHP